MNGSTLRAPWYNQRMYNRQIFSNGCVIALLAGLLSSNCLHGQNLFISDDAGGNIYKVTPDGKQTTFVSFTDPYGLAFNCCGKLLVGRNLGGSGLVVEMGTDGAQALYATDPEAPIGGMALDSMGNLYMANALANNVIKITPSGSANTFLSGLNAPTGLAFDSLGNLFESDGGSGNIYEFTNSNGTLGSTPGVFASGLNAPWGLAFDGAGNLYVANSYRGNAPGDVIQIAKNGMQSVYGTNLDYPIAMAFNAAGSLFVACENSSSIIEITTNGTQNVFCSGLDNPVQLAFQPVPSLWVSAAKQGPHLTVTMPSPYYTTIIQTSTNLAVWRNLYTNIPPFTYTDAMTRSGYYRAMLSTNYY